jgi:hypothetical protein
LTRRGHHENRLAPLADNADDVFDHRYGTRALVGYCTNSGSPIGQRQRGLVSAHSA